jgi:hypothetical protein
VGKKIHSFGLLKIGGLELFTQVTGVVKRAAAFCGHVEEGGKENSNAVLPSASHITAAINIKLY